MTTEFFLIGLVAVMLGGLVKGLSGFGYAIISTTLLASFFPASEAVAFLIIPLISIQLELLSELDSDEIKACTRNFEAYISALLVGTLAGFYMISEVPENIVKIFLGTLTLVFAFSRTGKIDLHIEKLKEKCFRRSGRVQLGLGFISGIVFGATNIAVQIVAYLKTMELGRRKFAGLLALTMIPISGMRLPLALINSELSLLFYSALAAPIGVFFARIGERSADKIARRSVERFSVLLLLLISINLLRTAVL